jgi:Mn-containing catalase
MPVDSAGNSWSGSSVYNSGNLTLDLIYNLMLEATGRLQKCRLYEMTSNKAVRSTISYLIMRDQAHENAYAKALETLGVNWGKVLPIPNFDATGLPEVKQLMDQGVQNQSYHWRLDGSEMAKIYQGVYPSRDGQLQVSATPLGANPQRTQRLATGSDLGYQTLGELAISRHLKTKHHFSSNVFATQLWPTISSLQKGHQP